MQTATPSDTTFHADDESLRLGPAEQSLLSPALIVAGVAGAVACFFGLRPGQSPVIVLHTYLVAYLFYLSITLGGLFFVLLHHLSRAGWSVTLRRIAEALAANIGLMALLTLPLLFGLSSIYPWAQSAAQAGGVDHDPSAATQSGFLTTNGFLIRLAVYFAVWGSLAWYMRSRSIQQDSSGDVELSRSMERVSAPGMLLFAFTITGAAVDFLMSMIPHWGSTIIGVYFFANCVLGGLLAITMFSLILQASGRLRGAVSVEHYHDLGKLTFAFVFFWGYIAFSQFMLIWYANLPEESQFFMPRQIGPWAGVSIVLIVFHLLIPFLGLLSRHAKRCLPVFVFWLVWMLAADVLDFFWLVMPNTFIRNISAEVGMPGKPLPEAFKKLLASHHSVYALNPAHEGFMTQISAPLQVGSLLMLAAVVLGMGGLYVASTTWFLKSAPLVPLADPRLHEALAFENT